MTLIDWLNTSPWTNLVFFILAVLGVVFTILFYLKSRRFKLPFYRRSNFTVLGTKAKTIEGLSVSYNNEAIERFSVAKFAIWNNGNEVIEAIDVAPTDQLRIVIRNDLKILDASIVYVKKKANNFSIKLSENNKSILISFDYFHKSEGLVVEIYHTGESKRDLRFIGTLKGVSKFIDIDSIEKQYTYGWFDILESMFSFIKINEDVKFWLFILPMAMLTIPVYMFSKILDAFSQLRFRIPKEYDLRD